ncbi:LmbU family transcriptional regulator [Streptomyces sp. NPDC059900]|uniref:LmbU family transcriptional regulator n=1 Tax=Streptomyces sp. NPDC059900 TaxID=3155816 RepID=UPI00342AF793
MRTSAGRAGRGVEQAAQSAVEGRARLAPDARMTPRRTALTLSPGLPLAQWRHIGRQIFVVADSSAWWLGDWLIYGRKEYPDRYRKAVADTGLDYQTLRNYAWVAGKFEPARRHAQLSFQHHVEVAGYSAEEREVWLTRAEQGGWSRNELRRRTRARRDSGAGALAPQMQLDLPSDHRVRWERAAAAAGLDLLQWIVRMLDEAADNPGETAALLDASLET